MTDPQNYDWRNYEYLRRGEALGSAAWGWIIGGHRCARRLPANRQLQQHRE